LGWDVIVVAGLGCLLTLPLWLAHRPPLQDLPQHVAAVQVLSRFGDARFSLQRIFRNTPRAHPISDRVLGCAPICPAIRCPVGHEVHCSPGLGCHAFVGVGVAARYWQRRLASIAGVAVDIQRACHDGLSSISLLPFPSCFSAWLSPSGCIGNPIAGARGCWQCFSCSRFYTHIVPFGVLLLAVVALAFDSKIAVTLGRLVPVLPSLVAGLAWLFTSPAGLTPGKNW